MNQEARKIKSFTDLNVWQKGHKLVLDVYNLTQNQLLIARDLGYISND